MSAETPVQSGREDQMAVIRMNGRHANALNSDLITALSHALGEAKEDASVRGVLLASDGKLFSPGLDLQELIELDRSAMDHFMEQFGTWLLQMYQFPKPLVAAVAGHAIAGGCVLAMTTDYRVLSDSAMIGLNEVRVGVPLPEAVALLLREVAHPAHRENIALLGNNYKGEEARAVGLAHEIVPREQCEPQARARLTEFISRDGDALALTKMYMRKTTASRMREGEARHREDFLDCWFSAGTQARIRGIVESLQGRAKQAR